MTRVREDRTSRATSGVSLWMMKECDPKYPFRRGCATTQYGIVAIYDQQSDPVYTGFSFVWKGRAYSQNLNGVFNDLTLRRRAARFAREIAEAV